MEEEEISPAVPCTQIFPVRDDSGEDHLVIKAELSRVVSHFAFIASAAYEYHAEIRSAHIESL